jgi:hypothetical protein
VEKEQKEQDTRLPGTSAWTGVLTLTLIVSLRLFPKV